MNGFEKVMSSWEQLLNSDSELKERNKSIYSTLEGKTAIQIEVAKKPSYVVDIQGGTFTVHQGSVSAPLLRWKLSAGLFKDVMLGKYRLVYGLLDPRGEIAFDTGHFTHWNGATIIEMLFLAQELVVKDRELSEMVKGLEE
jgi:hypothetical protein